MSQRDILCPFCQGDKFVPAYDNAEAEPDPLRKRRPVAAPRVPCPYCRSLGVIRIDGPPTPETVQNRLREIELSWE